MTSQRNLLTPVSFLALVVSAIFAWIATHPKTPTLGPRGVSVGPAAKDVNPDRLEIYRTDTVEWTLHDTAGQDDAVRTLFIEFESAEVFPRSKEVPGTNPKRYRIPCSGPYCISGAVGPKAVVGKDYKYWQVAVDAAGTPESADGHIIIKQGP